MLFTAVFGVIFGCAANTFAQPEIPIVGGYGKIDAADKEVVAAANFAVKAQAKKQKAMIKLVAVNNAARQVVAGMNYQVCLSIETTNRKTKVAAPQTVQAIIFKNLKGKYKLTRWAVADCADAEPSD
jgi:hypothetical protein